MIKSGCERSEAFHLAYRGQRALNRSLTEILSESDGFVRNDRTLEPLTPLEEPGSDQKTQSKNSSMVGSNSRSDS
jgi:hypothetical protein